MNLNTSTKMAVFIPEKLVRAIKAVAALRGQSISELTEEIFADFIEKTMPDILDH